MNNVYTAAAAYLHAVSTSCLPQTPQFGQPYDALQMLNCLAVHVEVKSHHEMSTGVPASSQVSEEVGLPAGVTTEHRTKPAPFQMPESL